MSVREEAEADEGARESCSSTCRVPLVSAFSAASTTPNSDMRESRGLVLPVPTRRGMRVGVCEGPCGGFSELPCAAFFGSEGEPRIVGKGPFCGTSSCTLPTLLVNVDLLLTERGTAELVSVK